MLFFIYSFCFSAYVIHSVKTDYGPRGDTERHDMKIHFSKSEAQVFQIQGGTEGLLYPASPRGDQSLAVIEMDGRYPASGYSLNDRCTETLYLLEGSFEVEYDGNHYQLKPGDVLMMLPQKKYRTWGKGKACVVISPSWDSKQNHIIES